MDEFTLTETQRKRWRARLRADDRPHGYFTELAGRLAPKTSRKVSGLKVQLSNFFLGERNGLKPVLDNEALASLVAQELGLDGAGALRAILHDVRAVGQRLGLYEVLIPGFEHWGPIDVDDVFVERGYGGSWSPSGAGDPAERSALNATDFANFVTSHPTEPIRLVVAGPHGSGRGTVLRSIARRLARAGHAVSSWPAAAPEGGRRVWLVSALDELDLDARRPLLDAVRESNGVLLASRSTHYQHDTLPFCGGDWLLGVPQSQVGVPLFRRTPAAAGEPLIGMPWDRPSIENLLNRLADLARPREGRVPDVSRMLSWYDGHPVAHRLVDGPTAICLWARVAMEGAAELSIVDFAPRFLEGLARRMMQSEAPPDVVGFVREFGTSFLDALVGQGLREEGAAGPVYDLVAEVMQRSPRTNLVPSAELSLRIVGTLDAMGLLRKGQSGHLATHDLLLVSAAVGRVGSDATGLDDDTLLRFATSPDGREALAAATKRAGDATGLLRRLLALPDASRAEAIPAVLRILAEGTRITHPDVMREAWQHALTWACAFGSPPTGAPGAGPYGRPELRPLGLHPLCLLALASVKQTSDLRRLPAGSLRVLTAAEAPALHLLASALGRPASAAATVVLRQIIATCAVAPALFDAAFWQSLSDGTETRDDPAIEANDLTTWWELAAGPQLRDDRERGHAILAAVRPGFVIDQQWIRRDARNTYFEHGFRTHLERATAGVALRFAEAILLTVKEHGKSARDALDRCWRVTAEDPRLRNEIRKHLIDRLGAAQVPHGLLDTHAQFDDWRIWHRGFCEWLVSRFLPGDHFAQVVAAWVAEAPAELPWYLVYAANTSPVCLVPWIAQAWPGDLSEAEPSLMWHRDLHAKERWASQGWHRDKTALLRTASPTRLDALAVLLSSGDATALERIATEAPRAWAVEALRHLRQAAPERHRRLYLEQMASHTRELGRGGQLYDWSPRPDEAALWQAIADRADTLNEVLVFLVKAATCDPASWSVVEAGVRELVPAYADLTEDDNPYQLHDWSRHLGFALFDCERAHPGLTAGVCRALMEAQWADHLCSPTMFAAWLLALGREAVVDHIERVPKPAHWLDHIWPARDADLVLEAALRRPPLAIPAARAIARQLPALWGRADGSGLVDGVAEQRRWLDLVAEAVGDLNHPAVLALFGGLAAKGPAGAASWLRTLESRETPFATAPLWQRLLPYLPPGPDRAHALGRALEGASAAPAP